jgi:hypothetical protein
MFRRALLLWSIAGVTGAAFTARAQRSALIQGTVTDSVHAKPAVGAPVLLTRLSPEPAELRSTVTDEKGRFHFDTLVAGRYSIAFATPYLDSLHLTMPEREVNVAEGQTVRIDFATPSGATLRAAACPDLQPGRGNGAVLGQVTDADTDQPLTSARVAVSWTDLSVDSALHPVTTPLGAMVAVDSLGRYHVCGVPTNTWLMLQVQDGDRAGSVLTTTVDADGGVLVRDLSLSFAAARSLASLDSAAAAVAHHDTTTPPLLTGTATLTGTVHSASGQPLSRAQVRIRDARGVEYTDSLGLFTLSRQPAGSQLLEIRRVGYLLAQVPVELRSGRTGETTVTLTRIVSLDSIRVVAHQSHYTDFDRRRKEGFGRFLDEKEIESRHPIEASDLFRDRMPGFLVEGEGDSTKVYTTHGRFELSSKGTCKVNVVINGVFQHQDVNLVDPANIGAVEAYPGPAGAPIQYDRACGVIVIWTKR